VHELPRRPARHGGQKHDRRARTPLIAAVPKMLFPLLVILPGMIAVALTAMPARADYRIPPPIIAPENYAKAVAVIKTTNPPILPPKSGCRQRRVHQKVNADKITALITANAATKLSDDQIKLGIYNAVAAYDYDSVIFSLVKKYCPAGLLGLALTALLASFMSGMAGNVTAFNTVWTYNLYQAFFVPNKSDQHYFWMGKFITVVGIGLSIGCAYFARQYNNAMDIIQLVFGFVNAPVFATFLLGMFWKRTTSIGAFCGLLGGIMTSTLFHALAPLPGQFAGRQGRLSFEV
jgi:SSS family solute:Na+ symporter